MQQLPFCQSYQHSLENYYQKIDTLICPIAIMTTIIAHSFEAIIQIKFNILIRPAFTSKIGKFKIFKYVFIRERINCVNLIRNFIVITCHWRDKQQINKMKQQSVQGIPQVPTVQYQQIMTEEFIQAYHSALKHSNLELDRQLKYRNISIYDNQHMHELYTVAPKLPHLVMLHGYGGTSLTFVRTFQHLKEYFQVHALDTFGVGLSSRGRWKDKMTPQQTGLYYIDAIEQWRKAAGIESFILVGHSFGGYISALYYQKYPQRVQQLIFLSPAGAGKLSNQTIQARARNSKFFFCVAQKIFNLGFRPSKIMNSFFLGNRFIDRILTNRLKLGEDQKSAWKKYLKHIVQIEQTSEGGFYNLLQWPMQPIRSIEEILRDMKAKIKIQFFFGDSDWMSREGGQRLAKDFQNIDLHIIEDAGHQLIFDNPLEVTRRIKECAIN